MEIANDLSIITLCSEWYECKGKEKIQAEVRGQEGCATLFLDTHEVLRLRDHLTYLLEQLK
jgi:hypothetical protein